MGKPFLNGCEREVAMEEKETLVICDHRNSVKCTMTCSHKKPHSKEPTDADDYCIDEGYCSNVRKQVQCEEIEV